MKINDSRTVLLPLAATALLTLGTACSKAPAARETGDDHTQTHAHEEAHDHDSHDSHEAPWHFVEGRGIRLSAAGKASAGVELTDVGFGDLHSTVSTSARVFAPATDASPARVLITLPEARAHSIQAGARLQAVRAEAPAATFEGRVEHVDRQMTQSTGTVELVAAVQDTAGHLETGAFLDIQVAADDRNGAGAATLPKSSILETARGDFVYVVNGEYLLLTPVTVGNASADQVEVLNGLFEGDVVASAGIETLWLTELQAINGGVACTHGH